VGKDNGRARATIGIDIGGTKSLYALFDDKFEVLAEEKLPTHPEKGGTKAFTRALTGAVEALLAEARRRGLEVRAVGAGCAGEIDLAQGVVRSSPNLGFLDGYALRSRLGKLTGSRVFVLNDVQAGLYGEFRMGAARKARHVIGVFLGTGVGGALLIDGRLHLGASLSDLEWTINAYSLVFGCLMLTGAALGDRFGRRRMYVSGLLVFVLGSALAALAPSVGLLIAARVVQGAGAAIVGRTRQRLDGRVQDLDRVEGLFPRVALQRSGAEGADRVGERVHQAGHRQRLRHAQRQLDVVDDRVGAHFGVATGGLGAAGGGAVHVGHLGARVGGRDGDEANVPHEAQRLAEADRRSAAERHDGVGAERV